MELKWRVRWLQSEVDVRCLDKRRMQIARIYPRETVIVELYRAAPRVPKSVGQTLLLRAFPSAILSFNFRNYFVCNKGEPRNRDIFICPTTLIVWWNKMRTKFFRRVKKTTLCGVRKYTNKRLFVWKVWINLNKFVRFN